MSAPTTIWAGDITADGKLVLDRGAEFRRHVSAQKPGRYELTLRRAVNRRGSAANRYFHGVVLRILADEWGWDAVDLKYELRKRFLPGEDDTKPPRHTSDLDTAEFARFTDDCRRFAAEHGVSVPSPNEVE